MTVRYVTLADVLAYHDRLLQAEAQPPAPMISVAGLEGALQRPRAEAFGQEFYPTLAEKAAVLLQGIVIAHPFRDGNKRTGLGAMLLFLSLNGVRKQPDFDCLYDLVIAVTTGELREVAEIAARLRELFASHLP